MREPRLLFLRPYMQRRGFRQSRENAGGTGMSDKILIVDDDREIRDVLRVLLTGERFEVAEASSGEEALAYLAEHPGGVDLVILDVMMEGISGYHVCLQLREQWNVPVLFLTAKSQESDLTMGYSSGGDDYLVKPFSYPELLALDPGQ